MKPRVAIAANFHLAGAWVQRLLVAEAGGWRTPREAELTEMVSEAGGAAATGEVMPSDEAAACARLFALPAHLRTAFWSMLTRQAEAGDGDFTGFAAEVASFLAFKELPPPQDAVLDLVVLRADGIIDGAGLWAVLNLGDEPVWLAWPELRIRVACGEGCRTPAGTTVMPPPMGDSHLLLVVRS